MIEDEIQNAKKKLTVGSTVKHNIEECIGEITETTTTMYEGLFTWSFQELVEDFYQGDLYIVS